ncbi:hypothetical protein AVEN_65450-1 [Araneus ventricosus]|uniref:Uncharacterized protein n=1 Tax=Araneus ventricosus TaxID=182803 RepID=A0A4Y2IIG9_ARAVE|nr:hypothetical protein AVEN_65450-1 [Araneus ventricosus]
MNFLQDAPEKTTSQEWTRWDLLRSSSPGRHSSSPKKEPQSEDRWGEWSQPTACLEEARFSAAMRFRHAALFTHLVSISVLRDCLSISGTRKKAS